jgi:8-oxo-dGTP diphosphatase
MIEVTCAIIENEDKILATRRAHGSHLEGFWEFPGGKTESGETAEECIVREIMEELAVDIEFIQQLEPVKHHYPEKSIRLIPFVCKIISGQIILKNHSEFRWLSKSELMTPDWAAADLRVAKNYLSWKNDRDRFL